MSSLIIITIHKTINFCNKIVYAGKGGTTSASGYDGEPGSGKPWKTFGNDKIDPNKHFLGTTNPADLVIKTNNKEQMRAKSSGNVGIGTTAPIEKLEVAGTVKATKCVGDGSMLTGIGGDGVPDNDWIIFGNDMYILMSQVTSASAR